MNDTYTILTLTIFPDGERHYHEFEISFKSTFDRVVEDVFTNRFRKAAYLMNGKGRLIDSYVKD